MVQKVLVIMSVLFVAAVGAVFGLLSDYTLIDEKAGSLVDNPVGFVLRYVDNDAKTVPFRAEIVSHKTPNVDFVFDDGVDSFYVDYSGPESKFIINGLSMRSFDESHIEFVDYVGKVYLSDKLLFSGSAKRVRTDGHTLSKDKPMSVSGENIVFSKVFLSKLGDQSLILFNVTGNVEIFVDGDSAVIPLNNRKFELTSFSGELQYYEDHIVIEGDGRLDLDFFKAPGE